MLIITFVIFFFMYPPGAHAREDFNERLDAEWMKHSLAHFDTEAGTTTISYR